MDKDLRTCDSDFLLQVAALGGYETLCEYLASGMDANCRNDKQQTPLHLAALGEHSDCVRRLLEENIDPTVVDIDENNALHLAAKSGGTGAIRALLDDGRINIEAPNGQGKTAMQLASKDHPGAVRVLLEWGAAIPTGWEDLPFHTRRIIQQEDSYRKRHPDRRGR